MLCILTACCVFLLYVVCHYCVCCESLIYFMCAYCRLCVLTTYYVSLLYVVYPSCVWVPSLSFLTLSCVSSEYVCVQTLSSLCAVCLHCVSYVPSHYFLCVLTEHFVCFVSSLCVWCCVFIWCSVSPLCVLCPHCVLCVLTVWLYWRLCRAGYGPAMR